MRWFIWGSFAVVWTVLLLLPGSEFKKARLDEVPPLLKVILTKSLHVLAFALFAFLSGWLRVPARYRWIPLFFILAHALVTEILQQYVDGRTGCLEDVGLNYIGILLGVIIGWKWWTDPK